MSLSLLDGSVAALTEALPSLSLDDLEALLAAEQAGKTRIGAVKAIEAAIDAALADAAEPLADEEFETIESIMHGSELHLGDGRRLAFGETAIVTTAIAIFLRDRKQAK